MKNKITKVITKVRKRDGTIVEFDQSKIKDAIFKAITASGQGDGKRSKRLSNRVVQILNRRFSARGGSAVGGKKDEIPNVEQIQDIIEEVLILEGLVDTAKSYILYREQRRRIREAVAVSEEAVERIDQYLEKLDWEVQENANMAFSLQGLNHYGVSYIVKKYWLNKIYPKEIREANEGGDLHIHNLDTLATYCSGWDLYDFLLKGFGGVPGKMESKPPKHFEVALGQAVNFIYTLAGEVAGAVSFSNFDTLLAPFIRYDNLNYKQVKQALQGFLFNMATPTRVGFQCPFSNLTLDLKPSPVFAKQPVIIGGKPQKETYSEFQEEMKIFDKAFYEAMSEGDKNGRTFSVDGECFCPIKNSGKIKLVGIGEYIDKLMEKHPPIFIRENNCQVLDARGLNIKCLGLKNGKVDWQKVNFLIRHPENNLLRIWTVGGFNIKVTPFHSVFVLKDGQIQSFEASKLKKGDYLLSPKIIPQGSNEILKISLAEEFIKKGKEKGICIREVLKENKKRLWQKRIYKNSIGHVSVFPSEWIKEKINDFDLSRAKISLAGSKIKILNNLSVTKELVEFLGWYCAEGSAEKNKKYGGISLGFNLKKEKKTAFEVANLVKKIWPEVPIVFREIKERNLIEIRIHSKLIRRIITEILEIRNKKEKRVPEIIFELSPEKKKIFLNAYFKGDAKITDKEIEVSSISRELLYGVSTLLKQLRIFHTFTEYYLRGTLYWRVNIWRNRELEPKDSYTISKIPIEESGLEEIVENILEKEPYYYDYLGRRYKNIKNRIFKKFGINNLSSASTSLGRAKKLISYARKLKIEIPQALKEIEKGELLFFKVKKIEKTNSSKGMVYDFSTESENFVADQLLVHNSFPIPTINITKDFPWDEPAFDGIFEASAKYGTNYFANYINSEMKPEDVRSMCLDGREEILIRNSKKIRRISIKEIAENYKAENFDREGWAECKCEGELEALSLNPKTLKLEWSPVKRFLKIVDTKALKITTENGKKCTFSLKHPMAIYTNEGIRMKFAKDLKAGEKILAVESIRKLQKIGNLEDKLKKEKISPVAIIKIKERTSKEPQEFYDIELEKNHLFVHSLGQISFNCCRLRLNLKELYNRGGGGLFGSGALTGSIGVATIGLPRVGYLSKTKKEFFERLGKMMDLAKQSLEIKRKTIENFIEKGLYPYSKFYLSGVKKMRGEYYANHFSTIGLVGMNEALLNFLGENIASRRGRKFALEVMDFMRERLVKYQKETGNIYNLEQTPAESSLAPSEKVLISQSDPKLTKIGPLIDRYLERNRDKVQIIGKSEVLPLKEGEIYTFGFSRNDQKIKKYPITALIRHPGDSMYEIITTSGRKVRVTKYHSVFTLDEKGMPKEVKVEDLKKGEVIAIPKKIEMENQYSEFNLIEEFKNYPYLRNKLYLKTTSELVEKLISDDRIKNWAENYYAFDWTNVKYWWRKKKAIPLKMLYDLDISLDRETFKNSLIFYRKSKNTFPIKLLIPINRDLGFVLGIILAEGWIGRDCIEISNTDRKLIEEIKLSTERIFGPFAFRISLQRDKRGYKPLYVLTLLKLPTLFINKALNLKGKSSKKSIPSFAYFAPEKFVAGLLKGFTIGDGSKYINKKRSDYTIRLYTNSKELREGFNILLLKLGILAKIRVDRKDKINPNWKRNYILSISGIKNLQKFYLLVLKKEFKGKLKNSGREKIPKIMKTLKELIKREGVKKKDLEKLGIWQSTFDGCVRRNSISLHQLKEFLEKFGKVIKDPFLETLKSLVEGDLYWDPIKSIKKIKTPKCVYDFEVDVDGDLVQNFLGGEGLVCLHNTAYRLALKDKEKYPDIITAGTKKVPYYTNSSQLPVNYTNDPFEALKLQDEITCKYTGGSVLHLFLGERISDIQTVKSLIKKVFEKFHLPYLTLTPTFSICPAHGYLAGEHFECPKCTIKQPCEVYSRICGYLRPVNQFNIGKQQEFRERKEFKVPAKL